jgi:hypothetical protein
MPSPDVIPLRHMREAAAAAQSRERDDGLDAEQSY